MNKKSLTLSIIIPVYNEEDYIGACLDSIASQTIKPLEVLVIDNNSTDRTDAVVANYKFVKLLSEVKQGRSYAQKTGFDNAKGSVIARIDADTHLAEDWVANTLSYLEDNSGVTAVTGKCSFYDFPFLRLTPIFHHLLYQSSQKIILGTGVLWGANMALRTEAWKKVEKNCKSGNDLDEDIDLTIHLHEAGYKIKSLPTMRAEVSMRRGEMGFVSSIKYLSTWPKTYQVNDYRIRALYIHIIKNLVLILGVPLYIRDGMRKIWQNRSTIFRSKASINN